MRTIKTLFMIITVSAAAAALPGRLAFGFDAGGAISTNDHGRWGAGTTGYAYYVEAAYEPSPWLLVPVLQYGYGYGQAPMPAWEAGGYAGEGDTIRTETADFLLAFKARLVLWRMKLRPYAGGGVLRSDYHRKAAQGDYVLHDHASGGWGYAAMAGTEYFPDPARGFSLSLDYRFGRTEQEWLELPQLYKTEFPGTFSLSEHILALGVKIYVM